MSEAAAAALDAAFHYSGEELDALAQARNYYGWITERFAPVLGRRVVEAGAGIGTFTGYLLRAGVERVTAIEPAANNFPHLERRYAADPRVVPVRGYLDETVEPAAADSVVAVNVMEHVPDDGPFLRAARRALVPGGHVCLFVPALPALFGSLDEAFEHYRRYTRRSLADACRGAGLEPVRITYMNLPGIAAWWMAGKVLRRRTVRPADARLYDRWVIPWVRAVEGRWSPPLGQSLLAIAKNPSSSKAEG